jgi:hypothetical protein
MFSVGTDTAELRIPDGTTMSIGHFICSLSGPQPPIVGNMTHVKAAIHLLVRYDCTEAAKRLLYRNIDDISAYESFDAFVLASTLNDLLSACRILAQAISGMCRRI